MFEKEAEEWVKENMDCCKTDNFVNQSIPYFSAEERCIAKSAFKDGAEFGYNKANEWHYVNDGDLPNTEFGRVDVTVAYIDAYENTCKKDCCFDGTNFIYWDARKPIGWKKVDIFGKIYAWKYPEKLPELSKEL